MVFAGDVGLSSGTDIHTPASIIVSRHLSSFCHRSDYFTETV